jgi:hypothetical protein
MFSLKRVVKIVFAPQSILWTADIRRKAGQPASGSPCFPPRDAPSCWRTTVTGTSGAKRRRACHRVSPGRCPRSEYPLLRSSYACPGTRSRTLSLVWGHDPERRRVRVLYVPDARRGRVAGIQPAFSSVSPASGDTIPNAVAFGSCPRRPPLHVPGARRGACAHVAGAPPPDTVHPFRERWAQRHGAESSRRRSASAAGTRSRHSTPAHSISHASGPCCPGTTQAGQSRLHAIYRGQEQIPCRAGGPSVAQFVSAFSSGVSRGCLLPRNTRGS